MLSCLSVRNTLCVEFHTLTPEEAIKLGVDTVTDVRGAIMTALSCPSVRNTLCVEFQPLFFQRPAFRG
jgi:hypothetical protein